MDIAPIINSNFVSLDHDLTLSEMIGKLKLADKRSGLVFRKGKYIGVIERKELLKTRIDLVNTKISKFVQKTPAVHDHNDIIETAYLMFQSDLDSVPVLKDSKIIGVIEALALTQEATSLPEIAKLIVDDVKPVKIPPLNKDDPVSMAIGIMYKEHADHIPLVRNGAVYGIISMQDILKKYLQWPMRRDVGTKFKKEIGGSKSAQVDMPHLSSLPISSFSTNDDLLSVNVSDNLAKAIEAMARKKVYTSLIMDRGELAGLLTVKNILRRVGSLKIPKNFNTRFIGLADLNIDSFMEETAKKIISNEAFKLQRQLCNEIFNLTVHFKPYRHGGRQQKYSVHLKIEYPGQIISVGQEDWDLPRAIRKTFNNAKNKIRQKFRTDSNWDKPYI